MNYLTYVTQTLNYILKYNKYIDIYLALGFLLGSNPLNQIISLINHSYNDVDP